MRRNVIRQACLVILIYSDVREIDFNIAGIILFKILTNGKHTYVTSWTSKALRGINPLSDKDRTLDICTSSNEKNNKQNDLGLLISFYVA